MKTLVFVVGDAVVDVVGAVGEGAREIDPAGGGASAAGRLDRFAGVVSAPLGAAGCRENPEEERQRTGDREAREDVRREGRTEARNHAVPVATLRGKGQDFAFLAPIRERLPAMIPAFVLAAGLGTRLRPLTDDLPKPLVPVGATSAFATIVTQLRAANFQEIVANGWHAKERLQVAAAALGVQVSVEEELLGTAGGLVRAGASLGSGDVLVWNGDILATVAPAALVAAHGAGTFGTLVVRPALRGAGNVGLDGAGRVVRLRQEVFGHEEHGGEFVGIHVVGAPLREALPEVGCLVTDGYLPALRRGAIVGSYLYHAPFFDVGTPESYLAANRAWLAARGEPAWLGPGARVTGTALGAVVGAGASVDGNVQNAVIWPDTRVVGDVVDAIATPVGIIRLGKARA